MVIRIVEDTIRVLRQRITGVYLREDEEVTLKLISFG